MFEFYEQLHKSQGMLIFSGGLCVIFLSNMLCSHTMTPWGLWQRKMCVKWDYIFMISAYEPEKKLCERGDLHTSLTHQCLTHTDCGCFLTWEYCFSWWTLNRKCFSNTAWLIFSLILHSSVNGFWRKTIYFIWLASIRWKMNVCQHLVWTQPLI